MDYQTNYSYKAGEDIMNQNETISSCFSRLFSDLSHGTEVNDILVYIKDVYRKFPNNVLISEDLIIKWVNVLKSIGLNLEYDGICENLEDWKFRSSNHNIIYKIKILETNQMRIRLSCNLIRYIYEYNHCVLKFFELIELFPNEDYYTLIDFSNYFYYDENRTGHNIFQSYPYKLVDNSIINTKFKEISSGTCNTLNLTERIIGCSLDEITGKLADKNNIIPIFEMLKSGIYNTEIFKKPVVKGEKVKIDPELIPF